jgi:hypothetical protein
MQRKSESERGVAIILCLFAFIRDERAFCYSYILATLLRCGGRGDTCEEEDHRCLILRDADFLDLGGDFIVGLLVLGRLVLQLYEHDGGGSLRRSGDPKLLL